MKAMELLRLVKLDDRADHTPSELSGENSNVLRSLVRLRIIRALSCLTNQPEIWIRRLELKY